MGLVLTYSQLRAGCPRRWDGLKAGTFQRIFSEWELEKEVHERDYYKLFSILTSTKIQDPSPEKEEALYQLIRWVNETPIPYSKEIPKSITIDHRTVEIPERVEDLSIGQNILVKQLLDKSKYIEECLTMAVSIYLQGKLDGKFDYDKAKALDVKIREMKASEVYGLGFFLLTRALKRGGMRSMILPPILSNLQERLRKMFQ